MTLVLKDQEDSWSGTTLRVHDLGAAASMDPALWNIVGPSQALYEATMGDVEYEKREELCLVEGCYEAAATGGYDTYEVSWEIEGCGGVAAVHGEVKGFCLRQDTNPPCALVTPPLSPPQSPPAPPTPPPSVAVGAARDAAVGAAGGGGGEEEEGEPPFLRRRRRRRRRRLRGGEEGEEGEEGEPPFPPPSAPPAEEGEEGEEEEGEPPFPPPSAPPEEGDEEEEEEVEPEEPPFMPPSVPPPSPSPSPATVTATATVTITPTAVPRGAPSPVQNLLFMMLGAFDSDDDDAPPLADLPSLIISETSEVSFTVPVGVSTAAFLDGLRWSSASRRRHVPSSRWRRRSRGRRRTLSRRSTAAR